NQKRQTNTAFVQTALAPAEWPRRTDAAVARIPEVNVFRSVVAGKKDQRVVFQAQCFHLFEQPADLGVEVGYGGVVNLGRTFVRNQRWRVAWNPCPSA